MQTRKRAKRPRRFYALCLGTFPIEEARRLRDTLKLSPTRTVELKLRGRGKRHGNPRFQAYIPLRLADRAAIYITLKRSLVKMQKAAEVRDKLLAATRQR